MFLCMRVLRGTDSGHFCFYSIEIKLILSMLKLLTEYVGQKVKKTFFNLVFFGLWDEPSGFDSRVGLFQLRKAHCLWSSTVQIVLVYCVYFGHQ